MFEGLMYTVKFLKMLLVLHCVNIIIIPPQFVK